MPKTPPTLASSFFSASPRSPRLLACLLLAPLACGLFDDDQPPIEGGTEGDAVQACVDSWTEFLEEDACPFPYLPTLSANFEGDDVFWVDDPSNATTIGPGGWLFGNVATADWLGYLIGGDSTCGIACLVPQGHPCFTGGNQFCTAGDQSPGCMWCGPGTASECESFVTNACGDGGGQADTTGGGNADTTGGGGQADASSGGHDDTSGGAGAVLAPDVSMFTSQPDALFGTTQLVLDTLGEHAPPNLVAEDICSVWNPSDAVNDWFGDSILKQGVFDQIVNDAEMLLGYCDQLSLSMTQTGVEITSAARGTLAHELGFRTGDTVISLNGIPAKDIVAVTAEVMAISQASVGVAKIKYTRVVDGRTRVTRIRVQ